MAKQIPSSNNFAKNQPGLLITGQVIPLKYIDTAGATDGQVITYVAADGQAEWLSAGVVPSAYSLGLAGVYVGVAGTTTTLTNPQLFTTGTIGETTLTGTATFGTGSNTGTTGLAAALANLATLHATLAGLSGTDISGNAAALDAYNGGYGVGVFRPGVYTTASALGVTASKTITLSGVGDYVFVSTGGAITFGATDVIALTNGAVASRVYWVSAAAITTGATDTLKGNFLGTATITIGSTNNIEGRLLTPGAITIDGTATNIYQPIA